MGIVLGRYSFRAAVVSFSAAIFVWPAVGAETASIPNLSGTWGRNWFFFEPPPLGPSPVVSKLRKADGTMDIMFATVGDDTVSILKPEAAAGVRKQGEVELSGRVYPNPHNQCWPEPTPFVLNVQFGVQVLQKRDEVILVYLADNKVRRVRMNQPHPERLIPSWQGDSVGHYEGDTLVIDTVGFKVGPLSMVDLYGTPFSAALHVIERYRLIDGVAARDAQRTHETKYIPGGVPRAFANPYGRGDLDPDTTKKGMQVEISVEDAGMFTTRWSGLITYRPVLGEWPEAICAENLRESIDTDRNVPTAQRPDF